MTDKTKTPLAKKLNNSTSRLGLRALEPRILLDAAGFVTGADVAVDMLDTQSVAEDMATLFQNNTALAPRDEVSPIDTLISALKSADLGSADSKTDTDSDGVDDIEDVDDDNDGILDCLLYTSPSPRDQRGARMPSSA